MFSLKFRAELPPAVRKELDQFVSSLKAYLLVGHDEDGNPTVADSTAAGTGTGDIPAGSVIATARSTAPAGYVLCDGSALNRATYKTLFDAIGTVFGTGDGSTTFNVPDMRQRFPIGKAAAGTGSILGGTGGAIDHTHTGPSHTHTTPTLVVASGVGATVATSPTDAAGAGNTGSANAPFLALNFIIRTGL